MKLIVLLMGIHQGEKDIWLSKPAVAKQAESLAKGKSHSKKLITTLLSQ